MPKFPFSYFCHKCGQRNDTTLEAPLAPKMDSIEIVCEKCGDRIHVMATACPDCKKSYKYFLSDLDFPNEIQQLGGAYIKLIDGIRRSLADIAKEFSVPAPKRWSVKLTCECGKNYAAEIPLPQLQQGW